MITQETINRIFEAARIEEVVGDFVTLKKSGSNYKGLSPFSNEKTPSFMVSPAKQIFKDFSSGKGGNAVTFLMEHEHYTYPEALRYLAQKYNIQIEETGQTEEEMAKRAEKESLFLVNDFANEYFKKQLWETPQGKSIGLSYFKERGFTEETIREFQLGYSPEEYEAFSRSALQSKYAEEYLTKSGLSIKKGDRLIDRFRGRVMFPILSHTGRILGFGGRTLQKEAKIAKYLNSPESEIYHKSKTLYGLYQAKNELGRDDNCLLVEGYTDVISMHQAGVKNVVASSGTALTREQINLVKRYTQNITILYDGDPAGLKASLRGIDLVLEEGMNVNVLLFPEGEDPDSYSQKVSAAELRDYIDDEKQDFLRFKASLLLKEAGDNPLEKSKAAREIVESIARIPDALQRNAYVQECAAVLKMDERILFTELAQVRKNQLEKEDKERRREEQRKARLEIVPPEEKQEGQGQLRTLVNTQHYEQEEAIVWLLLNHPDAVYQFTEMDEEDEDTPADEELEETVAEYIMAELQTDELELRHPVFNQILATFVERYEQHDEIISADYFIKNSSPEVVQKVADLVTEKHQIHNWSKMRIFVPEQNAFIKNFAVQSVLRYREKRINDLIQEIQLMLKDTPNKQQVFEEKGETLVRLTSLKNQINQELKRII